MATTNVTASEYIYSEGKGPHVTHLKNQSISKLAPFSGLIISIICVNYFLIRFYILEGFLLKRLYGTTYTNLSETNRRGFVNHHIAGSTKIVILLLAAYPFVDNAFGNGDFRTKFIGNITIGDVLIIAAQMWVLILESICVRTDDSLGSLPCISLNYSTEPRYRQSVSVTMLAQL
jgi:uncharacterized membrane protein (UPF0182 family)